MTNKPTILIYAFHPDKQIIKEICAGIEEEGVLYEIIPKEDMTLHELSFYSAHNSILGSGIGIYGIKAELSLRSLPIGQSVFHLEAPTSCQARNLGTNAARAVKRMSFKICNTDRTEKETIL